MPDRDPGVEWRAAVAAEWRAALTTRLTDERLLQFRDDEYACTTPAQRSMAAELIDARARIAFLEEQIERWSEGFQRQKDSHREHRAVLRARIAELEAEGGDRRATMPDRDLVAEGRAKLAALAENPATDRAFDLAEWAGLNLAVLLDALESARTAIGEMQTAHESQLTRMVKERARLQRKVARLEHDLTAAYARIDALEAAQRPPLGYVVGFENADGWGFNRFYGGPHSMRAGAEHELANEAEENPEVDWKLLEIREAQP
jgi:hypothetical protein